MGTKLLASAMHVGASSGHLAQKGKLFDSTMHVGFLGVDGEESFGRKIVCWYYARGQLGCEQKRIVG